MCKPDPDLLETRVRQALVGSDTTLVTIEPAATGSRRRRLWELDSHAHCPVVGVCLPIAALRRLADKVLGGRALADDYELHCGVIAECKLRTPMAEAVQRELDRRGLLALRQSAGAKTTEALAAWWDNASQGKDLAAAFWATLTHARCTPALQHRVLGEVHMLQHQVGMARRVDLQRFEALADENGALSRELAAAQARNTRQADEHARRCDQLQTEVMQMRAQLIGRDTAVATLQDDLQSLRAAAPGLKSRIEQAREIGRLLERNQALQRGLQQSQEESERLRRRADERGTERGTELRTQAQTQATEAGAPGSETPARLDDKAVLCVGGRPASVPVYRQLIEGTGGHFLHHDGGDEDNPARLDALVAAADLVICQTGCISHDAYWRVKDQCKRSGKRCVFVENPSGTGLKRALQTLVPAAA